MLATFFGKLQRHWQSNIMAVKQKQHILITLTIISYKLLDSSIKWKENLHHHKLMTVHRIWNVYLLIHNKHN